MRQHELRVRTWLFVGASHHCSEVHVHVRSDKSRWGGSQRENKHVIYSRAEVDVRAWKQQQQQQQKFSQGSLSGKSWTHSVHAVKNWWFLKMLSWETLTGLEKRQTSVIMGQQQTDIAPVKEVTVQTAEVQEGGAGGIYSRTRQDQLGWLHEGQCCHMLDRGSPGPGAGGH